MKLEIYEEYAQDKVKDHELAVKLVRDIFNNGELTEIGLLNALKSAFDKGHYVGHCRAEAYCKNLYTQGFYNQFTEDEI